MIRHPSSSDAQRGERRAEIDRLLDAALSARLPREPAVAAILAGLGEDGPAFILTHYTFDEPEAGEAQPTIQFTYHLTCPAHPAEGQEIRGSGMASFDDQGGVRLSDVDAELYRFIDDLDASVTESEADDLPIIAIDPPPHLDRLDRRRLR